MIGRKINYAIFKLFGSQMKNVSLHCSAITALKYSYGSLAVKEIRSIPLLKSIVLVELPEVSGDHLMQYNDPNEYFRSVYKTPPFLKTTSHANYRNLSGYF
jgi:hypothetical protein